LLRLIRTFSMSGVTGDLYLGQLRFNLDTNKFTFKSDLCHSNNPTPNQLDCSPIALNYTPLYRPEFISTRNFVGMLTQSIKGPRSSGVGPVARQTYGKQMFWVLILVDPPFKLQASLSSCSTARWLAFIRKIGHQNITWYKRVSNPRLSPGWNVTMGGRTCKFGFHAYLWLFAPTRIR